MMAYIVLSRGYFPIGREKGEKRDGGCRGREKQKDGGGRKGRIKREEKMTE